MLGRMAAIVEEYRGEMLDEILTRTREICYRTNTELTAETLARIAEECEHVLTDLPLVLREGKEAVADHDHATELALLGSLGLDEVEQTLRCGTVFRIHALLRSVVIHGVCSRLPVGIHPAELHKWREEIYRCIDELLDTSPCRLIEVVESKLRAQQEALGLLAQKVMSAQEQERRHLSVNIHDVLSQSLSAALYRVQAIEARLQGADEQLVQEAVAAQEALRIGLEEMRNVVQDLRPPVLDKLGLVEALREQAERFERDNGIQVQLQDRQYRPGVLTPDQEVALYRIVQEALTNVARHAAAERVRIRVFADGGGLRLQIEDNGKGFDPRTVLRQAGRDRHFGLLGIRERAQSLGGQVAVASEPGQGTRLEVSVPPSSIK